MSKMANKKKTFGYILIALPQIVMVLYLLIFSGLYYATLDDLLIGDIIRGAFTGGEYNAVYPSPVYNILVSGLYSIAPHIGWHGVVLLLIEFSAMLVTDYMISNKCHDLLESVFASGVLIVCWYLMWHHFTFTTVSYSAVICAGVALYCILQADQWNRAHVVIFAVSILMSILVRREVIASLIIIVTPFFLWRLVRDKQMRFLRLLAVLVVVYGMSGVLNSGLIKVLENEGYEWNESLEYIANHMDKQEIYDAGVWDESEIECFYEQIMYDKDVYSMENANEVAAFSRRRPFVEKLSIALGRLISILNDLRHPKRYENICFVLLVLIAVLNCLAGRRYMADTAMLALGFLLTLVVFAYINRYLYRTVMPGGVLTIMLLLMAGGLMDNSRLERIGTAMCLGVLIMMMVTGIPYRADRASQFDAQNIEAAEYFADHQDKLYLAAQSEAFGLMNCIPAMSVPPYEKANLIGNWNMYTGSYYAIVDSYGLKDPDHLVRSIPNSDTIRLVARTETGVPDYFIQFISEHSGKADVHAELEDTFYTVWMGEWGVYRVRYNESHVLTNE